MPRGDGPVVELEAKTPLQGRLPFTVGSVTVTEEACGVLTSIAPYRGRDKALSEALKAAHGMTAPAAGRATGKEGARAVWFGQRMFLLMGPDPDASLVDHAALTDQSDAWAAVRLDGAGAADVLARLTPVDLRPAVFRRGHTARTELQHMMASITRLGESTYQILVFRAFGRTLLHDLRTAMESVAARGFR